MNIKNLLVLSGALLLLSGYTAASEITREQASALMEDCQRQRQQKIEPLKTQAIADCINVKRKDKDYCERFYQSYGQSKTVNSASGAAGMFWDLPVCQQAIAAEKFFKANPGRRVYSSGSQ